MESMIESDLLLQGMLGKNDNNGGPPVDQPQCARGGGGAPIRAKLLQRNLARCLVRPAPEQAVDRASCLELVTPDRNYLLQAGFTDR
jgi:hypothetical protein